MTKASINLRDLRRRIYVEAKADKSHITLGEKPTGQPSAGNPDAGLGRGGSWKRGNGSRTEAHNERRGKATGP